MAKLTAKQERFCQEYLIDLNATQAAIRAGYSPKTAQEQASRLLSNVMVKNRVQELMDERAERTQITADAVIAELAKMGFANIEDYTTKAEGVLITDFTNVSRDQMAAVQEFTVDRRKQRCDDDPKEFETIEKFRFKLADKRGSLELLGKHLKLFTDKVEHYTPEGITFNLGTRGN